MRRIFLIAILSLFPTCAFAQDSLNISRIWQSEPSGSIVSIAREGDILYAAQGRYIKTFDISDFDAPRWLGRVYVAPYIYDMEEVNGRAYFVADSVYVVDCTNPSEPHVTGSVFGYGTRIAVNASGTNAYTISTDRWRSYDVSDPTNPVVLSTVAIQTQHSADLAAYENALFISTLSGLKIYDVTDPANPVVLDSILTTPGQVASCVEVIDDTLYVLKNGELHIFELTFPLQPVEIGGGFADMADGSTEIAKSDTMLVMAGRDNRYCFASIADIQDPVAYLPFGPGNWPHDVVVQGRQALFGLFADEFHLVDFTDPAEPFIVDTFTIQQPSRAHCLVGNTLISGYGSNSAIWTADITNISNPIELDRQFNYGGFGHFVSSGDKLAASRMDSIGGIALYDIHDPSHPVYASEIPLVEGTVARVAMQGDYLYTIFDSVAIYDISDLENPVQVSSGIVDYPLDLVVSDNMLYVLGQFQVYACSLDDPANPTYLGGYAFGGTRDYYRIIADGTTIYLYGEGMIQAVDLSNPQTPVELSPIGFFGNFRDFDAENGVLAVGGSSDGVTLVQYADPLNPSVIGYYAGDNSPGQVTLRGNNLFVSNYSNIEIFDISAALPVRDNTRAEIPTEVTLSAYPNPFNPSTTIAFDLNARAQVSLDVYDITGRLVRTLINEQLNAGSYTHNFDAQGLPSGAYFARLVTPQVSQTARITLIR